MILNKTHAEELLRGSLVLGCGGGGNEAKGRNLFEAAFKAAEEKGGVIELISVEELMSRKDDGVVVTISGVGSPSSKTAYTPPEYYPRLLELLQQQVDKEIIGFVPCEIGGSSSFEPFLPAALMGVPVIDAPCDGRAHPLGIMGSLGLEKKGIPVVQAAVGGHKGADGSAGQYVEIAVTCSLESASSLIRNASSQAGGFIAVARNPVTAEWIEKNGACGAYMQTLEIGHLWKHLIDNGASAEEIAAKTAEIINGKVIGTGKISAYNCATDNALDNGSFSFVADDRCYDITFFNEYMTLEADGKRISTFPDGIIFIGEDRKAYSSAMLAAAAAEGRLEDKKFILIVTPHGNLMIPTGVRYRDAYDTIEKTINKDMISYLEKDELFID